MNPTQPPGPHSDLQHLADQLIRQGMRAYLITSTNCPPYLDLTGPSRRPYRIYAHGLRFHLSTSCPVGPRDDIPLAAGIITWALHAQAVAR